MSNLQTIELGFRIKSGGRRQPAQIGMPRPRRANQLPCDEQYCTCCARAVASCCSRALSLITCCLPSLPSVTTGCLLCSSVMFELNCLQSSARLDGVSGCVPPDAGRAGRVSGAFWFSPCVFGDEDVPADTSGWLASRISV